MAQLVGGQCSGGPCPCARVPVCPCARVPVCPCARVPVNRVVPGCPCARVPVDRVVPGLCPGGARVPVCAC